MEQVLISCEPLLTFSCDVLHSESCHHSYSAAISITKIWGESQIHQKIKTIKIKRDFETFFTGYKPAMQRKSSMQENHRCA